MVWETAYRFADQQGVFPGPLLVARAAGRMTDPLLLALLASIARLLAGFVASVLLGVAMGLLLWRVKRADQLFGSVFLGLQSLPSVCWVPLALLLPGLGSNEKAILFVVVMGSAFAIALSMRDGLKAIPESYRRSGQMLGAASWRLYRYVILPSSLPALAGSLRLGFGFTWRSLMGAEVLFASARHGLGFLLSGVRNDASSVLAVMIVMILIGMIADRWVFAKLQQAVNTRFGLG